MASLVVHDLGFVEAGAVSEFLGVLFDVGAEFGGGEGADVLLLDEDSGFFVEELDHF